MTYQFEISKRLSREHQDVIALLERVQSFLRAHPGEAQPDWQGVAARRVLSELKGALAAEIPNHFAIEELELFPLYAEEGGEDMVEMLLADHRLILDLAQEIRPLVEQTLSSPDPLDPPDWETLRSKGQAFVTELCAHADKEEFGFVPALDECLEPATAARILERYQRM